MLFLTSHSCLYNSGFRHGYSTETTLLSLVADLSINTGKVSMQVDLPEKAHGGGWEGLSEGQRLSE